MKNFLKNFFSGNKTAEEKKLANEEKQSGEHDVIQITPTSNDKEDKKSGGSCCGGCGCGDKK